MVGLKQRDDGFVVPLLVEPGASCNRVYGEHGGRLKVSVAAPPQRGKANRALCKFLAAQLGLRQSQVRLLSGHNSRQKEVLIERVTRRTLDAIIS